MIESPNVRMALSSRPENVALVREVLAGLADAVDLGGTLEDVKAAVSEAANNVVMHAYGGHEGPMEVEIRLLHRRLDVIVRDHGVGIGPRAVVEDDDVAGRSIGLAVMEALAARVELRAHSGPGVEVLMSFDVPLQPELPGLSDADRGYSGEDGVLTIAIAPPELSDVIFNRVVSAVAVRAGFSLDRLSDAQLVADALAAHATPVLDGGHVRLGLVVLDHAIEVAVGPLRAGGSATLVANSAIGDLGPVIERLSDEVGTRQDETGEVLALLMRYHLTPLPMWRARRPARRRIPSACRTVRSTPWTTASRSQARCGASRRASE